MTLDADKDGNVIIRADGNGGSAVLMMEDGSVWELAEIRGQLQKHRWYDDKDDLQKTPWP